MARFRVSDSIASATASGWAIGFSRSSAARNRGTSTTSAVVSRPSVPVGPIASSDADTVSQPSVAKKLNRGLLDELVFGVGVRHGSGGSVG